MSTRRYRMRARARTLSGTRQRIVRAAAALHARHGIRATRWADIAKRADVSRMTVYRHFPTLEALVPPCARLAFEAIDLPAPVELERRFADLTSPADRLERLVRETCACYERGAPWLRAAFRERDEVRSLRETAVRIAQGIDVLLDVAVGRGITRACRAALRALLDFSFWQALRDGGLAAGGTADVIADLSRALIRDGKESRR